MTDVGISPAEVAAFFAPIERHKSEPASGALDHMQSEEFEKPDMRPIWRSELDFGHLTEIATFMPARVRRGGLFVHAETTNMGKYR